MSRVILGKTGRGLENVELWKENTTGACAGWPDSAAMSGRVEAISSPLQDSKPDHPVGSAVRGSAKR